MLKSSGARELERNLAIQLSKKTRRGIEITRPAETLVRDTKLAFAERAQGSPEVDATQGRATGMVVVGTLPLARPHLLPSAINAPAETNPEARVSVVDGPYDDLLHGLRNGDLDVLVGALRDPSPVDDAVQAPLFDDPFAVAERPDDPLASKNRISRARLASNAWIIARHGTPIRTRFEELFDTHTRDSAQPASWSRARWS